MQMQPNNLNYFCGSLVSEFYNKFNTPLVSSFLSSLQRLIEGMILVRLLQVGVAQKAWEDYCVGYPLEINCRLEKMTFLC